MTADPTRGNGKRVGWAELPYLAPSKATILVVDDDPGIRKSLQRALVELGHQVRTASSAEEADQWLSSQRFEVALLDIDLPRMSGVEFLSWALTRDPEMAVIMLTGLDLPKVAIECLDHGARTYLTKPVEAPFLRLALRDALAMRALLIERNDLAAR